ncbi:hypothetical protein [Lysinibacillus xylanilyticus]|uniref:hypothetical protein n=1 Tax=Lysinibacillus xylanilyticus TaxID=582475 RepID=UPI00083C917A|nr:hypothetical protein [Lysinibacillus xylanilyticus]
MRVKLKYTKDHIELFSKLQSYWRINYWKNRSIVIFIVAVIGISFCKTNVVEQFTDFNFADIFLIIISWLIYYRIVYFFKNRIYKLISHARRNIENVSKNEGQIKVSYKLKKKPSDIKYFKYLSLDLKIVDEIKSGLIWDAYQRNKNIDIDNDSVYSIEKIGAINVIQWGQIKIERKFFIEWSNYYNVIISIGLSLIIISLTYWLSWEIAWKIVYVILTIRIISRGIEVSYAFYKDVVAIDSKLFHYINDPEAKIYEQSFKSSIIRNKTRLSLVIHSLIELVILFGTIYYITPMLFNDECAVSFASILDAILFSASLGLFNYSFNTEYGIVFSVLHLWQVINSAVLILLSISLYLGKEDSIDDEKELYENVYINLWYEKS